MKGELVAGMIFFAIIGAAFDGAGGSKWKSWGFYFIALLYAAKLLWIVAFAGGE